MEIGSNSRSQGSSGNPPGSVVQSSSIFKNKIIMEREKGDFQKYILRDFLPQIIMKEYIEEKFMKIDK
jgi:hypothetical protein